ncbi:PREDICTED: oxidoreductase HTATIP2-like isoform X1 [Branchiostoma belcheri]|uniref:Protein HTATIP2 n=2 Tax=Branchiostoma belcheri TaxID=7741 RepID=A0A6P4Y6N3_BRABE|nr:PREDICTED: oxidoreductase HTATIP2-like isoform X1 [Branchiostoma belcheri]
MFQIGATILASFVVILGILIAWLATVPTESEEEFCRMAEAAPGKEEEFRSTNQTAFVVGHTGGTGSALVEELVNRNIFQKVVLIGRRKLDKYEEEKYNMLEQKIVDFEKLEDYADEFKGHSVGFVCLGAAKGSVGKEEYQKSNHDYIVKVAELAKAGGCSHFVLTSAIDADKDSMMVHKRLKGQVEAECTDMGFQKLSIFRPGLILAQQAKRNSRVLVALLTPIIYFKPTLMSVPAETIGKAMVNTVLDPSEEAVKIIDNKGIHLVASGKECKK